MKHLRRAGWLAFGAWLLLTFGCSAIGMRGSERAPTNPTDVAEAVWTVWHDVYQQEHRPPRVKWVTDLPCKQPTDDAGFKTVVGCRGGFCLSPLEVSVAWHGDRQISDEALAHELWHARQLWAGIDDPLHTSPGFQKLSTCGTCVYAAAPTVSHCQEYPPPIGRVCVTTMLNPCGECGIVEWGNEQLQRRGL